MVVFRALLLIGLGCTLFSKIFAGTFVSPDPKVVYGVDNRMEVGDAQDPRYHLWAAATAAMLGKNQLIPLQNENSYLLDSDLLEQMGICPGERFAQQMNPALCSGFLVAPSILVTAGHCATSTEQCGAYQWVFGFADVPDGVKSLKIPADAVYGCKRVIKRKLTSWFKNDFAVIELDRPVAGVIPLAINTKTAIAPGTPIVVIGHPSGLPTKIADGAEVRNRKINYFITNLDTFGGNSGSAVINDQTGLVEGILVRGERDYVYSSTQGCMVANHFEDQLGGGEEVTYIKNVAPYLP